MLYKLNILMLAPIENLNWLVKLFWIFDKDQHKLEYHLIRSKCCLGHIMGPPQKDGHDIPVLPYQRTLYEALQIHKHIWIKKSRSIGLFPFLLNISLGVVFSRNLQETRRFALSLLQGQT
jgi:hypothetical protein